MVSRLRTPLRVVRRYWLRLRDGYWLIPLSCVAAAVVAAFALIAVDRYMQERDAFRWTYAGGPQNASDTLTTIASSMITFTGLVFSITVLALQLTSSQFSPRALRNFLQDRVSQFALGIFIATFAYSFAALSAVRVASDDDPSFVPSITVTGAFVLVGVSLIMFVQYIHHTAQSIRVVSIIERIADETRHTIDEMYPARREDDRRPLEGFLRSNGFSHVLGSPRSGVIVDIDLEGLAACAGERAAVAELLHEIGTYVCEGQPLIHVRTAEPDDDEWTAAQQFVSHDSERAMRNDAAFGLRQLVDIAERALSPGVNDPTTAVQCLDRIHDLLRRLAERDVPSIRTGVYGGVVCAAAPSPSFDDLVGLGTEEIWHWGRESIQIQRRLREVFDDLLAATPRIERRADLRRRADALAAVEPPVVWPPSPLMPPVTERPKP